MVRVCVQELTVSEIRVSIKDRLPSSMQYELYDHQEDYCSLTHEYWCDLLYTIEVKDNRKRSAIHIKKISSDIAAYLSDSDRYVRIPRKEKARLGAGVLQSRKIYHNKAPKHTST